MKKQMKKFRFSIIVPLRDKVDSIVATLENILELVGQDISVWVVDDYSQDGSYNKAKKFIEKHKIGTFHIIKNPGTQGKISAIRYAMENCNDSACILLLDADSLLDIRNRTLQELQSYMDEQNLDVLAFDVSPLKPKSVIQQFQQIEYAIATNSLRSFLGIVTVISGAGSFWKTNALAETLHKHSKVFEGDDFEATLIAHQSGLKIGFLQDVCITTKAPDDWGKLTWQRLMNWEIGFWRCLMGFLILGKPKWLLTSTSPAAAHYRGIIITDLLMHPLKIITFIVFINYVSLFPVRLFPTQLNQLTIIGYQIVSLYWIFLVLGILAVNYCKTKDWRQRFSLNSWLIVYISIPYLSYWLIQPAISWAKRTSFYSGEDLGVSRVIVDTFQYLVQNSAFPMAFSLWILISIFLLLRVKSIRLELWSLKRSIFLFPIYQMAMLVFVRSISLFIWLGFEINRKLKIFFSPNN